MSEELLAVTITAKDKVIFQDNVKAITSYNEKGVFDILPEHTNFITLIKDKIIIHSLKGSDQTIEIDNGVIKVAKNKVDIFINLVKLDTDILKNAKSLLKS